VELVLRRVEALAAPGAVDGIEFSARPICSSSLPSGAYFWMAPSPLPATQTFFSWSTKQPWIEPGTVV
jgi:hypothetical protein